MATITPRAAEPAPPPRPRRADASPRRLRPLAPAHLGLAAILVLSGLLEFVRLSQNGYANTYYAATVKSMLRSWHAFFFLSADPNGLISSDKPPLGLWLQALSAKLFGFAPLSLLIPEGICAVLAVALIYRIVAPRFGSVAGLVSAFSLAVFPSFVAVSRDNGVDPLLILLMLAACGAGLAAIDSGRLRTLAVVCGAGRSGVQHEVVGGVAVRSGDRPGLSGVRAGVVAAAPGAAGGGRGGVRDRRAVMDHDRPTDAGLAAAVHRRQLVELGVSGGLWLQRSRAGRRGAGRPRQVDQALSHPGPDVPAGPARRELARSDAG